MSKAFLEANEILIWGLDTFPEGIDASDLDDAARIAADPPTEAMIQSIMRYGVRSPVPVRKVRYGKDRTQFYIAIDGRRRIRGTREANRRLAKKGNEFPIKVPYYIVEDSDAKDPILFNSHVALDSPLTKGEQIAQHRRRGTTQEDLETLFGVSRVTLANWQRLTALVPEARAVAGTDVLPWTEAYELAKLPAKEQSIRLAGISPLAEEPEEQDQDADADGPVALPGRPARPRKPRLTVKMRPAKELRAFADTLAGGTEETPDGEQALALAVLVWALGGEFAGEYETIAECLPS